MSIPDYKYKFYYDRKPEEFFDNDLYEFAVEDMVDKFNGNREKSQKYYETLNRVKDHIKIEHFSFKDSEGNIRDGEYQTLQSYSNLENDLKLLQLEGLKEKLEHSSKALAGDNSVYNGDNEALENDLKYIKTNNFAYNRNQMTTQNLKTLGRYGEEVRTNSKILNAVFFVRNNIRAPISRFIGKRVSNSYSKIFKGPKGLYDNKPTHRYKARRDYFYNQERKKAEERGKKFNPFISLWKSRVNAILRYKEGNERILEAGKNAIRESVDKIKETKYLADKYNAVSEHIKYLKEKIFMISDTEEIENIKQNLTECLNIRDEIKRSEFFKDESVKQEYLDQTDAITFEQHFKANKDNVTRTITGIKLAATAGMIYVGPKIKDWILEHTKIPVKVEQNTWVPGNHEKRWVEDTSQSVNSYTEEDLINNFSIENMMNVSKDNTAYYSYNELSRTVSSNNLEYFRGIAQRIDDKVISLSDGNDFNIEGITTDILPENLLVNGNISENATIFDLIAALRTKAGYPTTSKDLINQILELDSIDKQNEMIRNLTSGIEFWKSSSKSGIATGWNESQEEINSILESLSTLIKTRNANKTGSFQDFFTPGHFDTKIIEDEIINPRILKICNITENMIKGLSTAEIVNMIYENLRRDVTGKKLKEIENLKITEKDRQRINSEIKSILKEKDVEQRFQKINEFSELKNLTDVNCIEIINSFIDRPDILIKLLNNQEFYSKDNFKFILGNLLSSKDKIKLLENEELLEKIRKSTLLSNDIDFIINAYGKDKTVLKLFPIDNKNYLDNEELILRKTTTEYDEKVIDRLLYLKNINPKEIEKVKTKLKELYEVNDEILDTVNFEILTSRYDNLSEKMPVLTVYPELQEKICGLSDNEYIVFSSILKNVTTDWIPLFSDLLKNVSDYDELINKDERFVRYVSNLNLKEEDSTDELLKTISIISNPNRYDIKDFDDFKNLSVKESFNRYIINRTKENSFKKLSKCDRLKDFIFQKYLGEDFESTKKMYEYYGRDIEKINEIEETEEDVKEYLKKIEGLDENDPTFQLNLQKIMTDNSAIKNILSTIKIVLETENFDELKEMFKLSNDLKFMPKSIIESNIREFFTRQKNKAIYMTNEKDKVKIGDEDAYLISDDFNLQLTSIESYAADQWIFKKDDEKKVLDWDCKKVKTHGISTTFCGNKNLSLPPIHGVCYGFDKLDSKSLLKSAPWDLGAWSYNKDFDILRSEAEFGTSFTLPETQLSSTLRRHNEDVIERRNLRYKKGEPYKLQPSYLISFTEAPLSTYFKHDTDEVLTSEKLKKVIDWDKFKNRNYQRKVVERELEKDEKWKKTINESRKKCLSKVVVDRTHTLINERLRNDEKEKEFLKFTNKELDSEEKMEDFLQLMEEIIVDFDAARAGVIQKEIKGWNSDGGSNYGELLHKEMYNKLYSYKVMDDKLGKIEDKISGLDKEKYQVCMQKMKEIAGNQVEKISKSYWWYEYDTSHDWYHYYKFAGRELSGIRFGEDEKVISKMLDKNVEGLNKKGGEVIYSLINDIENIHEYDIPESEPDWHGRKHINNVVLFSYLIEQNEESLGTDIDLLLQAAKYHDVGRDGNWNGQGPGKRHDKDAIPHAQPSAEAAEFYLSKEQDENGNRKYTDSQIAMVKVAIEYHEVNEKNRNDFNEEVFDKLCKKEKVQPDDLEHTRLMCIYLKDADAVDRTRFLYEEKGKKIEDQKDNLDLRFLRTNTAIALRDFARDISNENHKNEEKGIRKNAIPEVLEKYAIPNNKSAINWEETQKEIKKFNESKKKYESIPKGKLKKSDIEKIIAYKKTPISKIVKCRVKFKNFINKIKNRENERKV